MDRQKNIKRELKSCYTGLRMSVRKTPNIFPNKAQFIYTYCYIKTNPVFVLPFINVYFVKIFKILFQSDAVRSLNLKQR
jgi:hypothetical protein